MSNRQLINACCIKCGRNIPMGDTRSFRPCCPDAKVSMNGGVLVFGDGYSEYISSVHRENMSTPEKRRVREAWEKHYVHWCLQASKKHIKSSDSHLSILSLGCGIGLDVLEFIAQGHDAYGLETADISDVWREYLGIAASRCVVSTEGTVPFAAGSFDLIVSMNVLEHVGTVPPKELVTDQTDIERMDFVRSAVKRLKPGGVFLLVAPNKYHPIDRGHAHWYIPFTYKMMSIWSLTLANPFSSRNFLPSPKDISRWCENISSDMPLEVSFIKDRSLFGLPPKEPGVIGSLKNCFRVRTPNGMLPHIQAVIRRS